MLSMKKTGKEELFIETDAALSQKFSEAGFGRQDGESLLISPLEAAYLVNLKKTNFPGNSPASESKNPNAKAKPGKATLEEFIAAQQKKNENFRFAFAVYAIIRGSGRILVPAGDAKDYFRVYAPGVGRPENRPSQLLRLMPSEKVSLKSIKDEIEIAHRERLELIVAVGEVSEPKFYKISAYNF
jgi:hypothetical protein